MPSRRSVVLVEGESDRVALVTLARRLGCDLGAEGIEVTAMGGVTNLRAYAARHGPQGEGFTLRGLYDAPEERHVRRGLVLAGVPVEETSDLETLGFFACRDDLEDELLRALGPDVVEEVIAAAGEGRSLELLAGMPAQRGWARREVVRRFLTSQGGRKARYAALFVEALDLDRVPAPLIGALGRG